MVSEVMLQQTQVDRVVPKYNAFIKKFPTAKALARAPLTDVLRLWSGLGYNRRAKYLWEAAKRWPKIHRGETSVDFESLPGVGPYTASAVRVFAYNEPHVLIETNIRTVFLHHLFPKSKKVPDSKLVPYIVLLLKGQRPRKWYAALMDYGSYLKKLHPNPSRRSAGHNKQSKFKGSDREIRGAILRAHLKGEQLSKLQFDSARIKVLTVAMRKEGLLARIADK